MQTVTSEEYEIIRKLVYEKSRINLGAHKKELVTSRLSKRLKACNYQTFKEYCRFVSSPAGTPEIAHLIDAISTNHTLFFRENDHFTFLTNIVLPEFVKNADTHHRTSFNVWSSASSTGEEPYSVALTLTEFFKAHPQFSWHLDGTDISSIAVDKATHGIFAGEKVSPIPQKLLDKYFIRHEHPKEITFEAKPELKRNMRFYIQNLLKPPYPFMGQMFSLILCRNVMIYFDRKTQEELVSYLERYLLPGGYLFIGHSESLAGVKHNLKMLKPAIYQKP